MPVSMTEKEGLLKNPLTIVVVGLLLMGAIGAAGTLNPQKNTAAKIYWLSQSDASGSSEIEELADDGAYIFSIATGVSGDYRNKLWLERWTEAGTPSVGFIYAPTNGTNEAVSLLVSGENIFMLGEGTDLQGDRLITIGCEARNMTQTLWQRTFDLGQGKNFAIAMTAYGDRLFVVGSALNAQGVRSAIVVAFDANSGSTLWVFEEAGSGRDNQFYDVVADSNGVYVAGYVGSGSGYLMVVIGLDASTGEPKWEHDYGGTASSTCPAVIEVNAGKIIASGYLNLLNGTALAINLGLNAADGTLLWESFDYAGGSIGTDARMVGSNLLISGLWHGKFYAGSFKASDGARNWLDSVAITGEANFLTDMDLEANRMVVAFFDQSVNDTGEYLWKMMVRAYEPSTGKIIQTEMASGSGATSDGVCLNIINGNIYAATGVTGTPIVEGAAAEATTTVVTTDGYTLKVNGANFTFKGVNYAPTPIGITTGNYPWGDYSQDGWQSVWNRDIPAIKEMNANTLKLYGITAFRWDDPSKKVIDHSAFYNMLKDNGLYVIPMVWFSVDYLRSTFNPSHWDDTDVMIAWKMIVAEAKSYSSVLGYCIGNEINPGELSGSNDYWMNRYYSVVSHIKDLDPNKMSMISLQDDNEPNVGTKEIKNWNALMPKLDVWGVCVYRGLISQELAFTDLFQRYANLTDASKKPLIISEFGVPASYHDPNTASGEAKLLPNDANATAEYARICWSGSAVEHDDIVSNLAYNATGVHPVCVGGFAFEWTDEWGKGDHGLPTQHNGSPATGDNFPGKWWDEKWFGVNGVETTGRSNTDPYDPTINEPDTLQVRAAYYLLKSLWA